MCGTVNGINTTVNTSTAVTTTTVLPLVFKCLCEWKNLTIFFLSFFSLPDKCLDAYLYQVLTSMRKNMLLKLLKKVTVLQKVSYDTKVRRKKARKTTSGNSGRCPTTEEKVYPNSMQFLKFKC